MKNSILRGRYNRFSTGSVQAESADSPVESDSIVDPVGGPHTSRRRVPCQELDIKAISKKGMGGYEACASSTEHSDSYRH
jgi:hypothetical protein